MDLELARRCCLASAATYGNTIELARISELTVDAFDWNPLAGFFAWDDADVIVAFRGTLPVRRDDVPERWKTMLGNMVFNFAFTQTDGYGGRVHAGFAAALDRIWPALDDKLTALGGARRRLIVTGHSKGAALATLAAWRWQQQGRVVAGVYTFGSPRVGNAAFARAYPAPLFRFENKNDLVPHLPPPPRLARQLKPLLGSWVVDKVDYEHAGELYFLDWSGKLVEARSKPMMLGALRVGRLFVDLCQGNPQALEDHRCEAYVAALRDCV